MSRITSRRNFSAKRIDREARIRAAVQADKHALTFYSGVPCAYGHGGLRYIAGAHTCVDCSNARYLSRVASNAGKGA
jgi:hypothetical protein